MAFGGHENAIRIFWIDDDGGNLLGVAQPKVRPSFPGVGGFVEAIADREIGALQTFTAADIKYVGIGRSDGKSADRAGRLIIEDRRPRSTEVGGLPNAAIHRSHVKHVGLVRNAADSDGAATAEGTNAAPAHFGVQLRIILLRTG